MRRRFEDIRTVAGGKIPVFACTISAPKTSWRNSTPILNIRDRNRGGYTSADYPASEVNNSIVCTMDGVPINCLTSVYSGYMEVLFNSGNVTGDITLQFTIGDVFYYFFITDKTNDIYMRPQLNLDPKIYSIITIHIIKTISVFVPADTYIEDK